MPSPHKIAFTLPGFVQNGRNNVSAWPILPAVTAGFSSSEAAPFFQNPIGNAPQSLFLPRVCLNTGRRSRLFSTWNIYARRPAAAQIEADGLKEDACPRFEGLPPGTIEPRRQRQHDCRHRGLVATLKRRGSRRRGNCAAERRPMLEPLPHTPMVEAEGDERAHGP